MLAPLLALALALTPPVKAAPEPRLTAIASPRGHTYPLGTRVTVRAVVGTIDVARMELESAYLTHQDPDKVLGQAYRAALEAKSRQCGRFTRQVAGWNGLFCQVRRDLRGVLVTAQGTFAMTRAGDYLSVRLPPQTTRGADGGVVRFTDGHGRVVLEQTVSWVIR